MLVNLFSGCLMRFFPSSLPGCRRLRLLVLTCLVPLSTRAQQPAGVSGTALDVATGQPLAFATATLHQATDSVAVKVEFTNEKGAFRLDGLAGARYRVSVAQVGFGRVWSAVFELPAAGLALPPLQLQPSAATNLKEVTVVGQKPLYERLADRTVVNVEGSTLAAGNTALDVLKRAPGVTTDNADNLALRGKQGVLVLLDGKRVPMTGTELADLLRSMPAEQLKNIELITNPPAKYDAQGGAGIIAINLRKDQRLGTNATLNLGYGRGVWGKFNSGLALNHRRRKLNTFASYSYADRRGFAKLTIDRTFRREGRVTGTSFQDNHVLPHFLTHTWKAGLDWNLSDRTLLGVAVNGQHTAIPQAGTNLTRLFDAAGNALDAYRSTIDQSNRSPNQAANLNFKHTFQADSAGARELTADADYARYATHRKQSLLTRYELSARADSLVRGDQTGELAIQSIKADYTHPLSRALVLEAGAKASYVTADNDVVFTNTVDGVTLPDPNQTNRFRYTEQITAGYLSGRWSGAPGWDVQVGLRGEQTDATGRQDIGNDRFDRHYFQLFPSLGLKRALADKHELTASLSRRIDRPSYQQLNPFRSWIDATTYGSGNKDLRPQTSYNGELGYTWHQKYSATLGYIQTRQPIVGVVQPESATSNIVVSRDVNLTRQHFYSLTLTAPLEITKQWSAYLNAVGYYNRFQGTIVGTGLNRGRSAFNLSANSSIQFPKGWSADVNASYQSREIYGFFDLRPFGDLTVGCQKTAWQGRGTFKLNVTDIFYTSRLRATSTYQNYEEFFFQRRDARVATVSLSYRVGNDKLAPARRRQGGAEDEKRRAG